MKRIYISGKMTGLDESVYTKNFRKVESDLKELYPDAEIVSPLDIKYTKEDIEAAKVFLANHGDTNMNGKYRSLEWLAYIRADIRELTKCTHIVLASGWQDSLGAKSELEAAMTIGLVVCEIAYKRDPYEEIAKPVVYICDCEKEAGISISYSNNIL